MELFKAIYTRQSIGKFRPDPIPRQLVEQILDAAAAAPNHGRLRPWRFVVLSGNARRRLGDLMAGVALKQNADLSPEKLEGERGKPLRAPVLIAVGVDKPGQNRITEMENVCACAAAVENLLLAAHDLGLGAIWKTGGAVGPRCQPSLEAGSSPRSRSGPGRGRCPCPLWGQRQGTWRRAGRPRRRASRAAPRSGWSKAKARRRDAA